MSEAFEIVLQPGEMSLGDLRKVFHHHVRLTLDAQTRAQVGVSADVIADVIEAGSVVYGVNTGFGLLARTRIPNDQLQMLQSRLILSHAAGVGAALSDNIVRLAMVLKINSLAQGYSGVRLELLGALIQLLDARVYPLIPSKGSVGASGDLAPLAHMAALLLGEGLARIDGERVNALDALAHAGLSPMTLGPKEGLALINGTQISTALALGGLFGIEDLFSAAVITGSLSVEAVMGSHHPFDARIHAIRGHAGQIDAARAYRALFVDSPINASHTNCDRVQDPYSLRCQPQVMGACLDQLRFASQTLLIEANAVSDNPLIFPDDGDILSGGNFHAEPVAMAADNLALCVAEIGALSERRTALLIDSTLSALPPFLVENGGLNSGFMIAQVTAAALASENKSLAHPASVDSLPTSANQEDHVSMATFAARRLHDMIDNTAGILAVELLASAQGIDFRRPLKTSPALEEVMTMLRSVVPYYDQDRFFAPDIQVASALILQGRFNHLLIPDLLPSL